ncbi:GMC oxidoreductase [Geodermatophilus amargosae]|uniref:GMC oxidoreductase n=1 Tax=Geodermatophilus amargosae TaxID=1296565 RepID=UPI0034DF68E0
MTGDRTDFDVVVVGSGFGGSVMAWRLSDAGLDVCVLERGKAYPPGSFPRSPHDMAQNFWDPSEGRQGLFDVWSFSRISAVVSSGLGGGSLIYANVLLRKDPETFVSEPLPGGGSEDWPVTYADLERHYRAVEQMMDVHPYPLQVAPYDRTHKATAMQQAAGTLGLDWQLPNLAVTFGRDADRPVPGEQILDRGYPNLHGLPRSTCRLVGECDIGCNSGSKNSLDHTYLSAAVHRGAVIRTRCEVRGFQPVEGGYAVDYVEHHDTDEGLPVPSDRLPVHRLTCRRLVLAAGALGSTYLLLKNRSVFPRLSPMLGARFSGNGDYLGFAAKARSRDGGVRRLDPTFGPVITTATRLPDGAGGRGAYVEDAGYPEFVNWLVEEGLLSQTAGLGRFLLERGIARLTRRPRTSIGSPLSRVFGRNTLGVTSLPLLGMGRDVPDGWMRLRGGYLDVDWRPAASRAYLRRVDGAMRDLSAAMGARYVNPLWWLNLLVTVHPLGGCPMGTGPDRGVVDSHGRVFGHPGLHVADGSVMPGPVGANPSLTIAALADRFAERLVDEASHRPGRQP